MIDDIESSDVASQKPIGVRFVLASVIAQLLAPAAGTMVFDLAYSPNSNTSIVTYLAGLVRLVPYSWLLAKEPLILAVVLVVAFSTIPSRRYAVAKIVVVTLLNIFASGVLIVGRSL